MVTKTWTLLKDSAEAGCTTRTVPEMRSANETTRALAAAFVLGNFPDEG